jgi:hypothetical protein
MTANASAASVPRPERARPAISHAGRVVVLGTSLGLAGQLLFYGVGIGLNAPIAISLILVAGWIARRPGTTPRLLDSWLAPSALTFAVFAAIRADPSIVALDLLAALGLTGMALVSFTGRAVVRTAFAALLALALSVAGWVVTGLVPALGDARRSIPADAFKADRARTMMPILRGVLIAIPIVIVFVVLFSSADAVFASMVEELASVRLDVGDMPGRLALAAAIAWLATGVLAMTAASAAPQEVAAPRLGWRLGETEAVTVLVAVVAVFAVFVVLQAAYLFGGLDTLAITGLGYAEYARRGFFELVAVAILAGGLVTAVDQLARRRTTALVAGGIALAALTGVVVASAAFRMRLYQEAYGWTELRFYVLATIVLLGVLLAVLVAALLANRVRWIGHAVLVTGLAVGLALNLVGPVRFITEQNVARVVDPSLVPEHGTSGLDASYLGSLDMDAVPGLIEALPHLEGTAADLVRSQLRLRLQVLRAEPDGWQAWNVGRSAALAALVAAEERGVLSEN